VADDDQRLIGQDRFRGAVTRSRFQNSLPWGLLEVSDESCDMTAGLGRRASARRDQTARVRYETVRLLLVTRTVITFFDTHGRRVGLSFIPARPKRVRAALERHGWPIEVERLDLGGRTALPELNSKG
jgi:hypothetical protein